MAKLEEGMEKLGLEPAGENYEKLINYIRELEKWNPLYSLVNASGDELIIRHILDSLAGLAPLKEKVKPVQNPPRMADLGSGGGLPGIPLAIYMPDWEIHLVERSGKRCDFLNNAVLLLGLDNVKVVNKDLKAVKEEFDLITFRAFRPFLPEIIRGIKKNLAPRGVVGAYKGKKSSIAQEEKLLSSHFSKRETLPLKVPFLEGEERHLLFLEV